MRISRLHKLSGTSDRSKAIEDNRLNLPRRLIPCYPNAAVSTTRQAHSIVSTHRNALISMRKSFLLTV
jgi:hypothetical protein